MKQHSVIIIPGLGDDVSKLRLATFHWKKYGLEPVLHSVGWHNNETSFTPKLKQLVSLIDSFVNKGNIVSLVGTSAGGSAVLNAFLERKKIIHRVVNVCGRLRSGKERGFRSFEARTASSPSFAQSIKLFEAHENTLTNKERQQIMTVHAMFGDELVPSDTSTLNGAHNIQIPTIEHMFSIAIAMTIFSKSIIQFLTE